MTFEIHLELLRKAADNCEIRFLSPVYLVGSFESRYLDALDIDLVMVMTENRMRRLFGSLDFNERRFRFYRKQKLEIEKFIDAFDIDFKVQSEIEFKGRKGPQRKLGRYAALAE